MNLPWLEIWLLNWHAFENWDLYFIGGQQRNNDYGRKWISRSLDGRFSKECLFPILRLRHLDLYYTSMDIRKTLKFTNLYWKKPKWMVTKDRYSWEQKYTWRNFFKLLSQFLYDLLEGMKPIREVDHDIETGPAEKSRRRPLFQLFSCVISCFEKIYFGSISKTINKT